MNKPIGYILTVYNSKADLYGNRYYSMQCTRTSDGATGKGTISGGESNCTYAIRKLAEAEGVGYYYDIVEKPIREYDRMIKGWDYIGCTEDQIIPAIQKQFNA
jgi:hypothetical protein